MSAHHKTKTTIDLNCDLGESFGAHTMGNDKAVMPYISSANIACGLHAGDFDTMATTVRLALENDVAIGAHPGLPDLQGFGRRTMAVTPEQARNLVLYQTGALDAFVRAEGGVLKHIKPHGALYNMAETNHLLAKAIAQAVADYNPELIVFGLANGVLIKEAKTLGLKTASEVFADRTYQSNGLLTPRQQPGAVISDRHHSLQQISDIIRHQQVTTTDGQKIAIKADTICLHGDSPQATTLTKNCHKYLSDQGITIVSP